MLFNSKFSMQCCVGYYLFFFFWPFFPLRFTAISYFSRLIKILSGRSQIYSYHIFRCKFWNTRCEIGPKTFPLPPPKKRQSRQLSPFNSYCKHEIKIDMFFFEFNDLRRDVFVRFVDVGGSVVQLFK
jgi:hypothetical protein